VLQDYENLLFKRELNRLQKEVLLCTDPFLKEDMMIQIQLIHHVLGIKTER
jgi:hypothetical protein